ncbi:MAG TPA: hypothetical protein VNG53_03800 [Bacteroidia bacterium]|nr:hypothetical protein [Bacteroidia bacterium]
MIKNKKFWLEEAPKLILLCFVISFAFILFYELYLIKYPSCSETIFKLGRISSNISYSIIAASVFYWISQYIPVYLPRQQKKTIILFNNYFRTNIINDLVCDLKDQLGIENDETIQNDVEFMKLVKEIIPTDPIAEFKNWYQYLYQLKTQLIDTIRSMTLYNDYLSKEFLLELSLLEKELLARYTFDGHKTLEGNLGYAKSNLQQILIHNKHLQELSAEEFKKYKRQFDEVGTKYRNLHYEGR